MPRLSVWAVRLALGYLLLGFTLGALMLANKGVPFAPWAWSLVSLHIEVLIFGFILQLAFGVAYWILPRHQGGYRGSEGAAWAAVGLLNLGVWTAGLGGVLVGRVFEAAAGALILYLVWTRVRTS